MQTANAAPLDSRLRGNDGRRRVGFSAERVRHFYLQKNAVNQIVIPRLRGDRPAKERRPAKAGAGIQRPSSLFPPSHFDMSQLKRQGRNILLDPSANGVYDYRWLAARLLFYSGVSLRFECSGRLQERSRRPILGFVAYFGCRRSVLRPHSATRGSHLILVIRQARHML